MAIKHQLNIHLDYGPYGFEPWGLEVRYGYHFSGEHHLREQLLQVSTEGIEPRLKADLNALYHFLKSRIPKPDFVRLPHARVRPSIRPGGLTFVVLDQKRSLQLPIARLYFYEEIKPLSSCLERRIYLEKPDWTTAETEVCKRIRNSVRKLAWSDYKRLMGHHIFGATEDGD